MKFPQAVMLHIYHIASNALVTIYFQHLGITWQLTWQHAVPIPNNKTGEPNLLMKYRLLRQKMVASGGRHSGMVAVTWTSSWQSLIWTASFTKQSTKYVVLTCAALSVKYHWMSRVSNTRHDGCFRLGHCSLLWMDTSPKSIHSECTCEHIRHYINSW